VRSTFELAQWCSFCSQVCEEQLSLSFPAARQRTIWLATSGRIAYTDCLAVSEARVLVHIVDHNSSDRFACHWHFVLKLRHVCFSLNRAEKKPRNQGCLFTTRGTAVRSAPLDPAASSATARLRTRQKERLRLENDYRARWRCKLRNTEAVTIQARRIEPFEGRISVADEALDGY